MKLVRTVLGLLKEKQCYDKYIKCEFRLSLVSFLGHITSKDRVMVDSQKFKVVKNWARPSNVVEIHSFMGLASYYHQFIGGFTSIALHMICLIQKDVPFV